MIEWIEKEEEVAGKPQATISFNRGSKNIIYINKKATYDYKLFYNYALVGIEKESNNIIIKMLEKKEEKSISLIPKIKVGKKPEKRQVIAKHVMDKIYKHYGFGIEETYTVDISYDDKEKTLTLHMEENK